MKNIEKSRNNLRNIEGQQMLCIGRAADMLWIQFGKVIVVKNFRGINVEKGEYAIHVQCPWRFIQRDKIILGHRDIYIPHSDVSESEFDWEQIGMSIFDKKSKLINKKMISVIVKEVNIDTLGNLKIDFENGVVFEAITDSTERIEFWRFINNNTKEHTVIFEE